MDIELLKFSVCMSVYRNDNPDDFKTAFHSIYYNQTVRPSEVILVVDGPIDHNLWETISELKRECEVLRVIPLSKNMGHAVARQVGLDATTCDLVAVMDADDIAVPSRFELQLKAFLEHPDISVIGGIIKEFVVSPNNVVGTRICPKDDNDIKKYLKSRCPMNLVTVMFRKADVMSVGGYKDWYCEEDYYLWIRLTLAGFKFYNIQENLVYVRVGREMYKRRGGLRYFNSERLLQRYMRRNNLINLRRYIYNVVIRFIVQVAMPNNLRGWFFKRFART